MTSRESPPTDTVSNTTSGRIFFLDIVGGRVVSVNPDCSDLKVIVDGLKGHPDGVVVDVANGHVYWTNMGKITPDNSSASLNDGFAGVNDGSIERADLDGRNLKTIIPVGSTFTPKQLKI